MSNPVNLQTMALDASEVEEIANNFRHLGQSIVNGDGNPPLVPSVHLVCGNEFETSEFIKAISSCYGLKIGLGHSGVREIRGGDFAESISAALPGTCLVYNAIDGSFVRSMTNRPDAKQYEDAILKGLSCIKGCKARAIFLSVNSIEDVPEYFFKSTKVHNIITVTESKKRWYERGSSLPMSQNKKSK